MKQKLSGRGASKTAAGAELYSFIHALLKRRETLINPAREFEEIDAALNKYFTGVPAFTIGGYRVEGRWAEKRVTKVPRKDAKKYSRLEKTWLMNIKKVGGDNGLS